MYFRRYERGLLSYEMLDYKSTRKMYLKKKIDLSRYHDSFRTCWPHDYRPQNFRMSFGTNWQYNQSDFRLTFKSASAFTWGWPCPEIYSPRNRCARVIINCRNETGQSEIAMQALGWISLADQRAKNQAEPANILCIVLNFIYSFYTSYFFTFQLDNGVT